MAESLPIIRQKGNGSKKKKKKKRKVEGRRKKKIQEDKKGRFSLQTKEKTQKKTHPFSL
jgi:hypothetical protein